jgi:VanZ family protein
MKLSGKKYSILALLYLGLIFIQSSIPSERIPRMTILSYDKLIHGGIYLIAAILIYLAIREHKPKVKHSFQIAWLTFTITVLFGLTDEIHQHFVDGRHASAFDFLADTAGAAAGVFFIHNFRDRLKKKDSIKERD